VIHPPLLVLAFRRTFWPVLLVGGIAVIWALWHGAATAEGELSAWSHSTGVRRYGIWMTGLLVGAPMLIARAARLGHRLSGADAAWCSSRAASRLAVVSSSWAGAALAAGAWILIIAASAELGAGDADSESLQPVGHATLSQLSAERAGVVSFEVQAPPQEDVSTLRLPVGLIATGGPSARLRARLTRIEEGELSERELLIATRRPIELKTPGGAGALRLDLERIGEGALLVIPAERAEWWRPAGSRHSAALLLMLSAFILSQALIACAVGLGTWMRPAAATALLLSVGITLWFSGGVIGEWGAVMEHIAAGDTPAAPSLLAHLIALSATACGVALAWTGLRPGARA